MSNSETRNAVVLVIDRLGANFLGAYGSTWFETRNFSRLAAQSLVFDQAITHSPKLSGAYERMWRPTGQSSLIERLRESSIGTTLLTDDESLAQSPMSDAFDRVLPVDIAEASDQANSVAETELAHFFAQAVQAITEIEAGSCLWIHSRGLAGPWDAPQSFRSELADAEDPEPPVFIQPPKKQFDLASDDPDELLGYQQACAAQVTMIDDFLGVILDIIDSDPDNNTLLCVMSTRGYPLGEHGVVGDSKTSDFRVCHGESVHIPMMVCLPRSTRFDLTRSVRIGNLVQPDLISNWLDKWFTGPEALATAISELINSLPAKKHEAATLSCGRTQSIQTHAWKLIRGFVENQPEEQAANNSMACELFAKPDDRCEVNDVSRRCPQIVESLSQILDELTDSGVFELPAGFELADELTTRLS